MLSRFHPERFTPTSRNEPLGLFLPYPTYGDFKLLRDSRKTGGEEPDKLQPFTHLQEGEDFLLFFTIYIPFRKKLEIR